MSLVPTPKVCLSFIYNHRYEGNIDRLEALYGSRFSSMFHLMPFYRGTRANVLRTYRGSFTFQGFITDAYEHLPREGYTHYLFLADDLLLNRRLDETNLPTELSLSAGCGYIKELTPLTEMPMQWRFLAAGLVSLVSQYNVSWKRELPSAEEALAVMKAKGLTFGRLGWKNFKRGVSMRNLALAAFYFATRLRHRPPAGDPGRANGLPFPLLAGYGDFVIVPAEAMENFCHYCGVFAAAGLFVEIAMGTALALACGEVRQEKETAWHGVDRYTGNRELYNAHASRLFQLLDTGKEDRSVSGLLSRLAPDELYIHPVKLSQWDA